MRIRNKRVKTSLLLLGLVLALLALGFIAKDHSIFADSEKANSTDHYINIYDGGEHITIRSDADTVADALSRAGVKYDNTDIVEPGLAEKIDGRDYNINIYRSRQVLVVDEGKKKYIDTAAMSPEAVAEAAGIKLKDKDLVKLVKYDDLLESGSMNAYYIKRAKEVSFDYYGKKLKVRTQTNTIGEFLAEQGISVDEEENWISLPLDTELAKANNLSIYRQGKQTISVDETIAYTTREDYDYDLDYGTEKISQVGKNGKKTVTYEIDMHNGQEVSREKLSEIVTEEPVEQVKIIGRKVNLPAGSHEDWMAQAGIAASDYGYVNFIIEHESHWRYNAQNAYSGAYGLCQALPGTKMASAGDDWQINPITQLRWCNGYAVGRYGSWAGAYEFWQSHRWW